MCLNDLHNSDGRHPHNPAGAIDFNLFLDCVHCGLCTSSCPTYTELGDENNSPRGRIYLMRMVAEGRMEVNARLREHLDLCLDCRACETACPSGVHYGRLIEPFRLTLEEQESKHLAKRLDWFHHLILLRLFPYANRIRLAMTPVRIAQRLGIYDMAERLGLFKLIPGRLGQMVTLVNPPIPPGPKLPKFLPAIGRRRARVAFFVGCVGDAMFRHTHWATLRVLQQNGCDLLIPSGQGCCGAIHYHAGERDGARKVADANVIAFERLDEFDAIIVNHAGCGAMLKEYGLHWKDDQQPARQRLAERSRTSTSFSTSLARSRRPDGSKPCHLSTPPPGPRPAGASPAAAAWHDSRAGITRAARDGNLLRLGRHLQSQSSGNGRSPDAPQARQYPPHGRPDQPRLQRRLSLADRPRSAPPTPAASGDAPMDLLDLSYRGESLKLRRNVRLIARCRCDIGRASVGFVPKASLRLAG